MLKYYAIAALMLLASHGSHVAHAEVSSKPFTATSHARTTIYHSAQARGFTCWVGAWLMPDESLMVSFTEATGPEQGRPKSPPEIRKRLSWPPREPFDMNGLDLQNVHLASFDRGQTWKKVSADKFRSPMNYITGNCETALTDGTVVRGVWGFYLPFDPALPQTGFVQRSSDRTATWSKPIVPLAGDQGATFPVRLRQLRDGRLLLLGGFSPRPANGSATREDHWELLEPLLMVSGDGGQTWGERLVIIPDEYRKDWRGEEYDLAELANGDLLCVFRREPTTGPERWQAVLKKHGTSWKTASIGRSSLVPSGHPELLQTKEGPVIHFATTGVHWTSDAGKTWNVLNVKGTGHYPRSVQAADGTIYVFSHVGGDDAYGSVDQSILMDTFRLAGE